MRKYILIALILMLGACAMQPIASRPPTSLAPPITAAIASTAQPGVDPLTALSNSLANIAIPDLQAALADAQSHNDAVAAQCYSGLLPIIPQIQAAIPTSPSGAIGKGFFSAFQAARDLKSTINSVPALIARFRVPINLACGALQLDVQATLADPLGLFSGK